MLFDGTAAESPTAVLVPTPTTPLPEPNERNAPGPEMVIVIDSLTLTPDCVEILVSLEFITTGVITPTAV